ncbi:hypothetical protein RB597_001357 [Gaeumannomyces tritici]
MSQPVFNDFEEGEPSLWRLKKPWVLEILRRERHRPTADPNDEQLREMFNAAYDGHVDRLKVALTTLTQSREQVNISMLHYHEGWNHVQTPLHAAAIRGHLDAATLLIAFGADLEACVGYMGDQYTPLHYAVRSGSPTLVRLLLNSGADVTARWNQYLGDDEGIATFLALECGHEPEPIIETIDLLLNGGLDVNEPSYEHYEGNRLTYKALELGSGKLVKHLIKRGAILSQNHDLNLRLAAGSHRSSEALEFLIQEQGHHDIDNDLAALCTIAGNWDNHFFEFSEPRLRMAHLLISHLVRDLGPGKPLNDVPGIHFVLRTAISSNGAPLARLLLQNGVGTPIGLSRNSALFVACRNRADPDIIESLLVAGEDVNCHSNPLYSEETAPLLEACITNSDPEVIKMLLQAGAEINCRRKEPPIRISWQVNPHGGYGGDNALHESVLSPSTVKLLLDAGVDPRARNSCGETPLLTHARLLGARFTSFGSKPTKDDFIGCIRLLADACHNLDDINAVDHRGRSALHLLARKLLDDWEPPNAPYQHNVETYVEAVGILIRRGARLDIRDNQDRTVAAAFQQEGGHRLLEALRKAGAQIPGE